MEEEDLLFIAIFVMFLGFLIFVTSIINKRFGFATFLEIYFVLFFFFGLMISTLGLGLLVVWHVKNKKPFYVEKKKNHFPSFLGFGMLLLVIGFSLLMRYSKLNNIIYVMSIAISIMGIILLIMGLEYFIREVLIKKKNPVKTEPI
jgi:hypothetical protein